MSTEIFPALAGLEYPVVRTPIFRTLTQGNSTKPISSGFRSSMRVARNSAKSKAFSISVPAT